MDQLIIFFLSSFSPDFTNWSAFDRHRNKCHPIQSTYHRHAIGVGAGPSIKDAYSQSPYVNRARQIDTDEKRSCSSLPFLLFDPLCFACSKNSFLLLILLRSFEFNQPTAFLFFHSLKNIVVREEEMYTVTHKSFYTTRSVWKCPKYFWISQELVARLWWNNSEKTYCT